MNDTFMTLSPGDFINLAIAVITFLGIIPQLVRKEEYEDPYIVYSNPLARQEIESAGRITRDMKVAAYLVVCSPMYFQLVIPFFKGEIGFLEIPKIDGILYIMPLILLFSVVAAFLLQAYISVRHRKASLFFDSLLETHAYHFILIGVSLFISALSMILYGAVRHDQNVGLLLYIFVSVGLIALLFLYYIFIGNLRSRYELRADDITLGLDDGKIMESVNMVDDYKNMLVIRNDDGSDLYINKDKIAYIQKRLSDKKK